METKELAGGIWAAMSAAGCHLANAHGHAAVTMAHLAPRNEAAVTESRYDLRSVRDEAAYACRLAQDCDEAISYPERFEAPKDEHGFNRLRRVRSRTDSMHVAALLARGDVEAATRWSAALDALEAASLAQCPLCLAWHDDAQGCTACEPATVAAEHEDHEHARQRADEAVMLGGEAA